MSNDKAQAQKQHFQEAVKFIKDTKLNKEGKKTSLSKAPWVLLLGREGSGKSSLLAKSEISFNLAKKSIEAHTETNWWVNRSVVYLDTPGAFSNSSTIYPDFLKLVKKHCHEKQLHAIVLTLSVSDLLEPDEEKQAELIKQLSNTLKLAQKQLGKTTPVFLAITKTDLIIGFQEFFSHYAKDERQQIWGLTLTDSSSDIAEEFSELSERLNRQLISRLHHEPDLAKKTLIKTFPLHFSQLKQALLDFTDTLKSELHSINLEGIYFTSALQDAPLDNVHESDGMALDIRRAPESKAFFLNHLFSNFIPKHCSSQRKQKIKPLILNLCYGLTVVIVIALIALFFFSFSQRNKAYEQAETSLSQYQATNNANPKTQNLRSTLHSLNQLEQASASLKPHPWQLLMPGAIKSNSLSKSLQAAYRKASAKVLLPTIKATLETTLSNPSKVSPEILFLSLSNYLMLAEPNHFNKQQFTEAMHLLWQLTLPNEPSLQKMLNQQLSLIVNKQLSINPNFKLISQARSALNQIKPEALAFGILKAQLLNTKQLTLNFNNDPLAQATFDFDNRKLGVSSLYTPAFEKIVLTQTIPSTVRGITQGNWVTNPSKKLQPNQLTAQLTQDYFKAYGTAWMNFLNNIKLNPSTNLADLKTKLAYLAGVKSPIFQLIKLAKANLPAQALSLNPALAQIVQTSPVRLSSALEALKAYLPTDNQPQVIFQLTKNRMLNQGKNDPISSLFYLASSNSGPLRYWSYQLAQNAWKLLLKETAKTINLAWQNNIWPNYTNQIQGHYPFSKTSPTNTSLDSFINFFAPNAQLDQFYTHYLRAFIDTSKQPWHSKELNGLNIPFKPNLLNAFVMARQIQNTFFPDHDQHLYFSFSLKANGFSRALSGATLKLGAQTATFTPSTETTASAFTWPDSKNATSLKLTFNDAQQKQTLSFSGPWALWKLMSQANLSKAKTPNTWQAILAKGPNTLGLLLTTKQTKLPFSLKDFSEFRLEEQIT